MLKETGESMTSTSLLGLRMVDNNVSPWPLSLEVWKC
jgi:hypothetical protein